MNSWKSLPGVIGLKTGRLDCKGDVDAKRNMAEKGIGSIQCQLARPGSSLQKYRLASVGSRSYLRLALYEVILLVAGSVPGVMGRGLRRTLYPILFNHVGRSVVFGLDCSFRRPHCIELGDNVFLSERVALDVKSDNAAIILRDGVFVGEATVFSCPGGKMDIGEQTAIGKFSRLGSLEGLTVGRRCNIGNYTYIVGAGHASDSLERPIIEQPVICKGASVLGEEVTLGDRVTVLDGVTIGSGAVVESGSLVIRNVEPGSRVSGVPARNR